MNLARDALFIVKSALVLLKKAGRMTVDRLTVMKTAYLIEREYFLMEGEKLTDLIYFNYVYGPYNGLIIDALEKLASDGAIEKEGDCEYNIAAYNEKSDIPKEINERLVKILRKHRYSFSLVDFVHGLKEVKETGFGEEICFEKATKTA